MKLRDYQEQAINGIQLALRETNRILLISPTGSGKTVIACALVKLYISAGHNVLFLAHRKELVEQAVTRLADNGITAGIIMGQHKRNKNPVQVASVQTLVRRKPPQAGLIIIDEAHRATAASYKRIIEHYPDAAIIGLTATPFRLDGSGLGTLFKTAVKVATIEDLTERGFLVPVRYWGHNTPDMRGVKKSMGDYNLSGFKTELLGNPVQSYKEVGEDARAIAFCVNVEHAEQLAEQFNRNGVPAAMLSAKTEHQERVQTLEHFKNGLVRVITNCEILGEGYDCPAAEVVIMARPTASLGLYMQQVGRVLRPYTNKTEARVIDHAGNVQRHGFIGDVEADLSKGITKKKKQDEDVPSVRTCRKCYAIMPSGTEVCTQCGTKFPKQKPPKEKPALLVEFNGEEYARHGTKLLTPTEYLKHYVQVSKNTGKKPGWAWYMFQARFRRKPNRQEVKESGLWG